jgi:hypothetical protein
VGRPGVWREGATNRSRGGGAPHSVLFETFRLPVARGPIIRHNADMSKVQQMEAELQKLSPAELWQIRNWLDDLLEDQLQFTDEFEAQVQQSEEEMAAGLRPRVHQP